MLCPPKLWNLTVIQIYEKVFIFEPFRIIADYLQKSSFEKNAFKVLCCFIRRIAHRANQHGRSLVFLLRAIYGKQL